MKLEEAHRLRLARLKKTQNYLPLCLPWPLTEALDFAAKLADPESRWPHSARLKTQKCPLLLYLSSTCHGANILSTVSSQY